MNYKSFNLGDWIGHISGAIEDERELDGNEMRDLVEFLSGLPKWISCSKRTPEKSGVYIVTEKEYSVNDRQHTGRFNLITEQVEFEGVEFEGGKWRRASFYEVIAWMPLPDPYKESEDKK